MTSTPPEGTQDFQLGWRTGYAQALHDHTDKVRAGLARARAMGQRLGPKPIKQGRIDLAMHLLRGGASLGEVSKTTKLSRSYLSRLRATLDTARPGQVG